MTLDTTAERREAWAAGSYARFARRYLPMAAGLVEAATVDSTDRVLDVGCGTGNVAITAARQGARVTGVDLTPAMLGRARENAHRAGTDEIEWHEGDATDLPFRDDAFDVVVSALGHMYGDPPEATTRELLRVTRPDGRIAFTSWTPTSLFPVLAGLVAARLPPAKRPEFSEPPFTWGDRDIVTERLGSNVETLTFESATVTYPALSPRHVWHELATHSGLFRTFFDEIEDEATLREEVVGTIEPYFDASTNAVELEYLLTTATDPHVD